VQWPFGVAGQAFQPASFSLREAFNLPFTNDVILEIKPLMYKVHTNNPMLELARQPVWLQDIRAIRVKLNANGTVEKLE